MKIQSLIDQGRVFLDLEASDVRSAMKMLADCMVEGTDLTPQDVAEGLIEREKLGATSVGGGFAIPHCKLTGLKNLRVGLARFLTPVPFGESPENTVEFVFVVLSPPDQPALHLQVLSQIARILKDGEVRADLIKAEDTAAVVAVVKRAAGNEGL